MFVFEDRLNILEVDSAYGDVIVQVDTTCQIQGFYHEVSVWFRKLHIQLIEELAKLVFSVFLERPSVILYSCFQTRLRQGCH